MHRALKVVAIAVAFVVVAGCLLFWAAPAQLAQLTKALVFQPLVVPTGSMEPAIRIGDRVIVSKTSGSPSAGDIVALDDPNGHSLLMVKRVVAMCGQTVDIKDGAVWVDGARLDEPYVNGKLSEPGTVALPVQVPEGYLWVMGDNRGNSGDSRFYGPVSLSDVSGKVAAIYWPPNHAKQF